MISESPVCCRQAVDFCSASLPSHHTLTGGLQLQEDTQGQPQGVPADSLLLSLITSQVRGLPFYHQVARSWDMHVSQAKRALVPK